MTTLYAEYEPISVELARARHAWRRTYLLDGLMRFVTLTSGAVALVVGLEVAAGLPDALRRLALPALAVAIAAGFGLWVVARLFRAPGDEALALLVEKAFPAVDNGLINAVRLAKDAAAPSPDLVRAAMIETLQRMSSVDAASAVDRRGLKRFSVAAAIVVALSAAGAVAFHERVASAALRLLRPAANIGRVGAARILAVKPGDCVGANALISGDTLPVEVLLEVKEGLDTEGEIEYSEPGQPSRRLRLRAAEPGQLKGEIRDVKTPLVYRARAGGGESALFKVEVVEPPSVTGLEVDYVFPEYTGLEPRVDKEADGNVRAVAGSSFGLTLRASQPLGAARMLLGREQEEATLKVAPDGASASLAKRVPIEADKPYTIQIADQRGHANRDPVLRQIRLAPDAEPVVKIETPGKDEMVAPGGKMGLVVRVSDDFGLSGAEIVARVKRDDVEGAWETVYKWPSLPPGKRIVLAWEWVFDKAKYRTSDVVRYYVKAEDNNNVSGPGVGKSSEFEVRVQDAEKVKQEKLEKLGSWQEQLQKALEEQVALRKSTADLEKMAGGAGAAPAAPKPEDAKPAAEKPAAPAPKPEAPKPAPARPAAPAKPAAKKPDAGATLPLPGEGELP